MDTVNDDTHHNLYPNDIDERYLKDPELVEEHTERFVRAVQFRVNSLMSAMLMDVDVIESKHDYGYIVAIRFFKDGSSHKIGTIIPSRDLFYNQEQHISEIVKMVNET